MTTNRFRQVIVQSEEPTDTRVKGRSINPVVGMVRARTGKVQKAILGSQG